jgi:peptidoglycan/xylan/chitin deacetylase (PgdA/CDA1 family)
VVARLATLMYHDVVGGNGRAGGLDRAGADVYTVTAAEFQRQMDGIADAVAVPPLCIEGDVGAPGDGAWALTFDDGGAGAAAVGEALAARGWSAHFFIITDMVGCPGFLDWGEVRALAAQGHAIGSHSCSHPARMSELPPDRLREEWSRSIGLLSDALGEPVRIASVPGGFYSRAVGNAAAGAGIRTLFTSVPRRSIRRAGGCALAGRFAVRGSTPTSNVVAAATGARLPWLAQRAGWELRGAVKRIGGRRYERLRETLLARR